MTDSENLIEEVAKAAQFDEMREELLAQARAALDVFKAALAEEVNVTLGDSSPRIEVVDADSLEWALRYARRYWMFGGEPESQRALKLLSSALRRSEGSGQ